MNTIIVVSSCATIIVTVLGVASIFAQAWVKASDLLKLSDRCDKMQAEIDRIWDRFTAVTVLETKIAAIEDGIHEIKELLKR